MSCGNLLVLLPLMLMDLSHCESEDEKVVSPCCTTVSNKEITEPIIGYLVQKPAFPCVAAVIFQTETGLYCCYVKAPWVRRKIIEFRNQNKAKSQDILPPVKSTVSLLSILTSTAAPSSSSTVSSIVGEKLPSCCTTVSNKEITEPIIDYYVQKPEAPCVPAVIFQTETGLYCCQVRAPWVRHKIIEFKKQNKAQDILPPVKSTVSVLSILTSTAAPSSSSSVPSIVGEKLATCCTTVTNKEITEPIIGYSIQKPNAPCVAAVILQTKTGDYCCQVKAPWVRRKIMEFSLSFFRQQN